MEPLIRERTRMVLETWARHPEWPLLTVVQHPRIADFRPAAANIVHRVDYLDDVPWEEDEAARAWYARIKSRPSFRPLLSDRVPGMAPSAHYDNLDF